MLTRRLFSTAALAVFVLALAAPAAAQGRGTGYVIYLKDGTRIEAREKPVRLGDKLVFKTPLGATQSIPATELDDKKTTELNKLGAGTAYVLGDSPDAQLPIVTPKPSGRSALSQFVDQKGKGDLKMPESPTYRPEAVPAEKLPPQMSGSSVAPASVNAKGPKGEPPVAEGQVDPQTGDVFMRSLETAGIRGSRLSPIPGGVRIAAITESEPQVFAAISGAARGLKEARAVGRPVDKVDLVLATATGESGGRFTITTQDAEALLNGKISPQRFFVAQVQF